MGHGGLFSKAAYVCLILGNGSVTLKFIPGQPHKSLFIVTLALTACPVALYLRIWGRSTSSAEFVMRFLKRDPHGPGADGSFKALNCYFLVNSFQFVGAMRGFR